jgi:endonuclease/exonuclease/phosphatase family metal-dependent hydrolase
MTYNIPQMPAVAGTAEGAALIDLLRRLDPDVLTLQETGWRFGSDRTRGSRDAKTLVEETTLAVAVPDSGRNFYSEVPVLSKLPTRAVREWDYTYDLDQDTPLELIRTEIDWEGRTIALYNFHLASYGQDKPWRESDRSKLNPRVWASYLRRYRLAIKRRAWEARHVRRHLEAEQIPFIVAGDFNATPHNWTYRKVSRGLTDAFAKVGSGAGLTYHSRRPIARIDFILVSKELEPVSAQTVDGHVSDHLAVLASVRWK